MRRLAFIALILAAVGAALWLAARPTPEGDVAWPWRGPLARLYWEDRVSGAVPAVACTRVGDMTIAGPWVRPHFVFDDSRRPQPIVAAPTWRDRVPTHAGADCHGSLRAGEQTVQLRVDDGWVLIYARAWRVRADDAPALADSTRRALTRRLGTPTRCATIGQRIGEDAVDLWRAPAYSTTLETSLPIVGDAGGTPVREVRVRASVDSVRCRATA